MSTTPAVQTHTHARTGGAATGDANKTTTDLSSAAADKSDGSAIESESVPTRSESSNNSTSTTTPIDTKNGVMQSLPPSHILEDGRLIYLPPPNAVERSRFFERSIARHGLLQADMEKSEENDKSRNEATKDVEKILAEGGNEDEAKDETDNDNQTDKTAPKVHPLAIASARLQSNGLNELNRAINLATLVNTGEFFSYTNVVDPSFETDATVVATTAANVAASATKSGGDKSPSEVDDSAADNATFQRTEALFSLKRKRGQFEKASQVLERHEARLWAGVKAQHVIDRRLFQLRQQWRLVAPEHGTRAKLHAARTNEIIAVDVDVYDRDRVHGGNQALMGGNDKSRSGLAGRLASRVPRFATIELQDDFKIPERKDQDGGDDDSKEDKNYQCKDGSGDDKNEKDNNSSSSSLTSDIDVATENEATKVKGKSPSVDQEMKDAEKDERGDENDDRTNDNDKKNKKDDTSLDNKDDDDAVMEDATLKEKNHDHDAPLPSKEETNEDSYAAKWTRAEPYAVADPTLGRVIENFDPSKIPMLNLQLDILKSSTGFLQSACLEPMTTLSSVRDGDSNNKEDKTSSDEELLISLQHSLFCANLFESMRSELDPDTTSGNNNERRGNSFSVRRPKKALQSMAWLASESEENLVAPPSFLVGGDAGRGLAPLSVVHCHEGEVKVQLDSEYQLCLKLVEANLEQTIASSSSSSSSQRKKERDGKVGRGSKDRESSGSQSPARLHAFCRALLLYAQDVYHRHSLYLHEREKKMREDEIAKGDKPRGLARIKKEDAPEKARILQSCVSLGSKMLFEQRIRKAISNVSEWFQEKHGEKLSVEWLSLSIFGLHSKFTICSCQLLIDGMISRDDLTITKINDDSEDYRKVHFHTDKEFELYLKLELQRQM